MNNHSDDRRQQLKMLIWPTILSLFVGLLVLAEPLEESLRTLRNKLHPIKASGDIVLVQIDDKSLREVGQWPWPRSQQATLYQKLRAASPRSISADIVYSGPTRPAEDAALAHSLKGANNVALALITVKQTDEEWKATSGYIKSLAPDSKIASISAQHNWQMAVWQLPRAERRGGQLIPALNSYIAGIEPTNTHEYRNDYRIDPDTIPSVSASDLYFDRVDKSRFAGKSVVLGTNSEAIGDQYFLPGSGKRGGVFAQVIAAETAKRGTPVDFGWIPALVMAFAISVFAVLHNRAMLLPLGIAITATAPFFLEKGLIYIDICAALFLLSTVWMRFAWRRMRAGGVTNSLTGLPNLAALRADKAGRSHPLVAVRIHNYAEIASTLNAEGERKFVEQLVQRLTVGNREKKVYQGDEGIFAWFADKETPFAQHLEALHALFRAPVRIGKTVYDVSLSFGVELGSGRSVSSRLGSALVAAQEADAEALKWKLHDPARIQEAPWKLSLLSQLDQAIRDGEVWLAFQPKVDLATRQTVGVEALARWTHPEKGPISPAEFVAAAEQSDRIGNLTNFVLERAICTAADFTKRGLPLEMAVNLSARVLNDRDLPQRVADWLSHYDLQPEKLILELTETAAVTGSGAGIDLLVRLRDLGVRIAIDDYGTGLSTLDYLKKVPASEIKIDQSFIRSMRDNRSDLIMVQSTITLAHSLGRIVVAEGVEDVASLEQLLVMGCDQVQGFVVGRPMAREELERRLKAERRRRAA
jgi:EAL domain-containing protein (putative c-di-GMP-specific phosphodiesterase class I)/CHASE2 domain-containing sensor protein